MKTIITALTDEVQYPMPYGFFENKLIVRDLECEANFTREVAHGDSFKGAVADCLIGLVNAPNIGEGGVSISLSDKDKMLGIANSIYKSISERPVGENSEPSVTIIND